jgi:hypothetical protein
MKWLFMIVLAVVMTTPVATSDMADVKPAHFPYDRPVA